MRRAIPILALSLAVPDAGAAAQSTLERPVAGPDVSIGVPWTLDVGVGPLLQRRSGTGLDADPMVRAALVLPNRWVAEVRYAPQPVEIGGADDLEGAVRAAWLRQANGHWLDAGMEGRYSAGSEAVLIGVVGARWLGPLRAVASTRALFPTEGDTRLALGASGVWHPAPGRLPIALAADVSALTDRRAGEAIAWTAGVQVGVAFTPHTLSIFATNAGNSMLGRLTGTDPVRLGLEVTGHVPIGRLFGFHVDRQTARASVREAGADVAGVQADVVIPIREYRYDPVRIEVPAGATVEWVNRDRVTHTATADDRSWNSGGLEQGERWRAVFTEPGTYPYHCGPHPYMRGVIVVR